MRYLVYAFLIGTLALSTTPVQAYDNHDRDRGRWDRHDERNDSNDRDSHGHYGPPPVAYYAPPVIVRSQPLWIEPVRYSFAPNDNFMIIRWFRGHPVYYPQPLLLPRIVNSALSSLYGPVYTAYALPVDLERRLGPAPYGMQRLFVNNQILLIDMRTGNIHDAIYL